MSDGVLTRALADLERAGIQLAATLDPARRDDCLRVPGIGLKAFDRLQEAAVKAAELKRGRGGAGVPSRYWLRVATKIASVAAAAQGIAWEDADVFVAMPEPGRCFTKSPGRTALCANG